MIDLAIAVPVLLIGLVAALAALEPDLSVAVYYVLLMGVILFAGGVRVGHFVFLGLVVLNLVAGFQAHVQGVQFEPAEFAQLRLGLRDDDAADDVGVAGRAERRAVPDQELLAVGAVRIVAGRALQPAAGIEPYCAGKRGRIHQLAALAGEGGRILK